MLVPMQPPTASSGEYLWVFCSHCSKRERSDRVLCDLGAKPFTYLCQGCATP